MKTLSRLVGIVVLTLLPIRASAQWITFDPSALVQSILNYGIAKLEGDTQCGILGQITGINTQQLATQNLINQAIGQVTGGSSGYATGGSGRSASFLTSSALSQMGLSALSQGLGLNPDGSVAQIYLSAGPFSGSLDVFMGSSAQSFQSPTGEGGLLQSYYQNANSHSLDAIGASIGLGGGKVNYLKAVANMDPSTRENNKVSIAAGLAEASDSDFMNSSAARRQTIQAESNLGTSAANRASNSSSANETAAAQAEIAASQARMAAIHAQQANLAAETQIIQGDATNHILSDMDNDAARARAEALLAKKAAGNN